MLMLVVMVLLFVQEVVWISELCHCLFSTSYFHKMRFVLN